MSDTYAELGGQPSTAPPPADARRGCGQRVCNHIPDHQCPWLDETDHRGKAVPCPCWHQAAEKGRRG